LEIFVDPPEEIHMHSNVITQTSGKENQAPRHSFIIGDIIQMWVNLRGKVISTDGNMIMVMPEENQLKEAMPFLTRNIILFITNACIKNAFRSFAFLQYYYFNLQVSAGNYRAAYGERDGYGGRISGRDGYGDRRGGRNGYGDRISGRDSYGDRIGGRDDYGDRISGRDTYGDRIGERSGYSGKRSEKDGYGDRRGGRDGYGGRRGGCGGYGGREDYGDIKRDRLIGATVKMISGPFKSYIGEVRSAIEGGLCVKLHCSGHRILVARSHVAEISRHNDKFISKTPEATATKPISPNFAGKHGSNKHL